MSAPKGQKHVQNGPLLRTSIIENSVSRKSCRLLVLAAVVEEVTVIVPSVRLTVDACQAVGRVVAVRRDERAGDRLRGNGAVADLS